MTGGRWANVVKRDGASFRGGVMRTSGGSRVDTIWCRHEHATWADARKCAGAMERERAVRA